MEPGHLFWKCVFYPDAVIMTNTCDIRIGTCTSPFQRGLVHGAFQSKQQEILSYFLEMDFDSTPSVVTVKFLGCIRSWLLPFLVDVLFPARGECRMCAWFASSGRSTAVTVWFSLCYFFDHVSGRKRFVSFLWYDAKTYSRSLVSCYFSEGNSFCQESTQLYEIGLAVTLSFIFGSYRWHASDASSAHYRRK